MTWKIRSFHSCLGLRAISIPWNGGHFADVALPVDAQSLAGDYSEKYSPHVLLRKDGKKVNFGRLIEKGKALRTFISTEKGRKPRRKKLHKDDSPAS